LKNAVSAKLGVVPKIKVRDYNKHPVQRALLWASLESQVPSPAYTDEELEEFSEVERELRQEEFLKAPSAEQEFTLLQ
jgi:hypothetical protein